MDVPVPDTTPNIVSEFYEQFKTKYRRRMDKPNMIRDLIIFCGSPETSNAAVYELKKKLEIDFIREVHCKYAYLFTTPNDYGCDLREIIFNKDGTTTEDGEILLGIFETKKLSEQRLHILTDIDDTLYPNTEHGTYIAGSDRSWIQKQPYPGIISFYIRFYQKLPEESRYSTILSATPGFLKNYKLVAPRLNEILKNTSNTNEDFGFIQGIESKTELLSYIGNIAYNATHPQESVARPDSSQLFVRFGTLKFERFVQYSKIFPEYNFIFIGDNGQGDVLAGTKMLEYMANMGTPQRCTVAIHIVSDANGVEKRVAEQDMNISGLHFFTSYFELATIFNGVILFDQSDVDAIRRDTVAAFARIPRRTNTYRHHVPSQLSAPALVATPTPAPAATRNGGKKYGKYEKRRRTNKKKRTMMRSSKKYKKTRIN
jgi:hypothetical protein